MASDNALGNYTSLYEGNGIAKRAIAKSVWRRIEKIQGVALLRVLRNKRVAYCYTCHWIGMKVTIVYRERMGMRSWRNLL